MKKKVFREKYPTKEIVIADQFSINSEERVKKAVDATVKKNIKAAKIASIVKNTANLEVKAK